MNSVNIYGVPIRRKRTLVLIEELAIPVAIAYSHFVLDLTRNCVVRPYSIWPSSSSFQHQKICLHTLSTFISAAGYYSWHDQLTWFRPFYIVIETKHTNTNLVSWFLSFPCNISSWHLLWVSNISKYRPSAI